MAMQEALRTIRAIDFALLSPTEVRKYSVAEITQPETYDEDGMPVQGGLMDYRLGTLDAGQECGTCGSAASGPGLAASSVSRVSGAPSTASSAIAA